MITNNIAGETDVATSSFENRSLTLPPATLRNAEPQSPVMNRNISIITLIFYEQESSTKESNYAPIFGAKATAQENVNNSEKDAR